MNTTKITIDGTVVGLPDQKLKTLQDAVGGYIQLIPLAFGNNMIVNEDGLLLKLPPNNYASMIAGFPVVGNVVIIKGRLK